MVHRNFLAAAAALAAAASAVRAQSDIYLNGSVLSRPYDGFFGLSGGGATSRLLQDYEEPWRSQVLDYLFKPFFGASLHGLKVEMGGDTFSGCGTEPSHQHNASGDVSFDQGYEWALMRGAAARQPSILGYALSWGFPGWIGGSSGQPLNAAQAAYTSTFCLGVSEVGGGWGCDYVGIWNEESWTSDYVLQLRAALDAAGLNSSRIILADGGLNDVVDALLANATLRDAVYAVGVHYPGGSNSSAAAQGSGIPLWSSEDSSSYFDAQGGGCLARIANWNWLFGEYSALVIWNLLSAYMEGFFWYGDSFMASAHPWSGGYQLASPLWVVAHTAQFVWPGWQYLPSSIGQQAGGSAGGSGMLPGGGTYVTLVDSTGMSEAVEARVAAAVAAAAAGGAPLRAGEVVALRRALHEEHFATGNAFQRTSQQPPMHTATAAGPLHWSMTVETTQRDHSMCIRSNPGGQWSIAPEQNVTFTIGTGLVVPPTLVLWKSVFYTSPSEPEVVWFQRQADITVDTATGVFTLPPLHPDTLLTVSTLDRGQAHGSFPDAPPPQPAPFPNAYADDLSSGYAAESMPRYLSDLTGSFAILPRRDGAPTQALEQRVVQRPVPWHSGDDSLYPLTVIGAWNSSVVDVSVGGYIYSPAADPLPSDPLLSLLPCTTASTAVVVDGAAADVDASQVFDINPAGLLPGSLRDRRQGLCVDVFGCDTDPGTPLWMWGCVADGNNTNCNTANQQWAVDAASGHIVSQMTTGYCMTAQQSGSSAGAGVGQYNLSTQPCGSSNPAQLQCWAAAAAPGGGGGSTLQLLVNGSTAGSCSGAVPAGLCLSSSPYPIPPSPADTFVGVAVRLGGAGGPLAPGAVPAVAAYDNNWYNYGYFLDLRSDGSWRLSKGNLAPLSSGNDSDSGSGEGKEEEAAVRSERISRRGAARGAGAAPRNRNRSSRGSDSSDMTASTTVTGAATATDARITLAQGNITAGSAFQTWHTLRLVANGTAITASIDGGVVAAVTDGGVVAAVTDGSYGYGWAGLTSGWHMTQFVNLTLAAYGQEIPT